MIDYINYYYDLYPKEINFINNKYLFTYNGFNYALLLYERDLDELEELIILNKNMINNDLNTSEIIITKLNNALIKYQNTNYILIRYYVDNRIINIDDIFNFNSNINRSYEKLNRFDWANLWSIKVDYFEYQMTHIIKKYPLLNNTIDYYIGLSETAISYYKYIDLSNGIIGISHKRIGINSTLFDLYNPLNLIIDFKVRDVVEYIKDSFFNNMDAKYLLHKFYTRFYLDNTNLLLMLSRFLFPSYYFDLYEYIITNEIDENIMQDIIKKSSMYENFLHEIIINNNLLNISWIK